MISKNFIIENAKTIFYALIIAVIIRSFFIQPFYIPSSSMEPTLLVGDRLFVTKYSYGYSKHSFPFSPPILNGRIFSQKPEVGDVIVFTGTNAKNRRPGHVGIILSNPGEEIKFIHSSSSKKGSGVKISTFKDSPYYKVRFIKVVRVATVI